MSDDDRALIGRQRTTPVRGSAIPRPVESFDDLTDRYEGEELQHARSGRPTEKRFEKLEKKSDEDRAAIAEIKEDISAVKVSVAGIAGEMKILPALVSELRDALRSKREDEHVVLTTKLDIGKHEAKTRIDTQQVATKSKWNMAVQIVTGLFSAGVLGAAIALIASRC
jgi:hypothetical protein